MPHPVLRPVPVVLAFALALAGCGAMPGGDGGGALQERVDERTAVNVVTLSEPLLFSTARSRPGMSEDLALGPVEINRQGERSFFLWTNLLGGTERRAAPRLRLVAGGEVLLEVQLVAPPNDLPVSRPPYRRLAEWAFEAYYPVSPEDLARLRGRGDLVAEIADGGGWLRYEPWARTAALDTFIAGQLTEQVATR